MENALIVYVITYFVNNLLFVRFPSGNALSIYSGDSVEYAHPFQGGDIYFPLFLDCQPKAVNSQFPHHTIVTLASEYSSIKPFGLCFGILLHEDFHSQSDFTPVILPLTGGRRILRKGFSQRVATGQLAGELLVMS